MERTLTIFTPTYNRANLLPRCYESLQRQTCKDFIWMVIDDGSTDNTASLVRDWQESEKEFDITYRYKDNGGLHTGYNTAYREITTPLNMCIDSDDYLTDDAVEMILQLWNERKSEEYAGIIALDADKEGNIIGDELGNGLELHLSDFYGKGKKGDKKFIHRTEVTRRYPPYPEYKGEKLVPIGYRFQLIDQDYKMLVLNKPVCIVEYRSDGYTKNRFRNYIKGAKGFAYSKKVLMGIEHRPIMKFKLGVLYSAFSILAKDRHMLAKASNPLIIVLAIPFGCILSFYISYQASKATQRH